MNFGFSVLQHLYVALTSISAAVALGARNRVLAPDAQLTPAVAPPSPPAQPSSAAPPAAIAPAVQPPGPPIAQVPQPAPALPPAASSTAAAETTSTSTSKTPYVIGKFKENVDIHIPAGRNKAVLLMAADALDEAQHVAMTKGARTQVLQHVTRDGALIILLSVVATS